MKLENKVTYGIIGNPLNHSLSPAMHNAAFKALGIDAVYKLFPLKEDQLEDFFAELKQKKSSIFGLNVTVPYKEKALPFIDSLAPLVQKIQAVNTIVISKDRQLTGYNTDAPGFLAHLTELNFNTKNKRITILGSGGSARAIISTLCLIPERPLSIKVYNRTTDRARELIQDFSTRFNTDIIEVIHSVDDLDIELADLLINTTSVGLDNNDINLVSEEALHPNLLVYDLIYNPAETPLLKMAKKRGARVSNGLGMLYYQGVLAFQHWANIQLDLRVKKVMREALERAARQ